MNRRASCNLVLLVLHHGHRLRILLSAVHGTNVSDHVSRISLRVWLALTRGGGIQSYGLVALPIRLIRGRRGINDETVRCNLPR